MNIEQQEQRFCLLPYFHILKITNTLTKQAKIDLCSNWDYYFVFQFGWFIWHFTI